MFRLQIREHSLGVKIFYGEPFLLLETAHERMQELEEEFRIWQIMGCPQRGQSSPLQLLEGGEVYVVGDDITYWLDENNEFRIMN